MRCSTFPRVRQWDQAIFVAFFECFALGSFPFEAIVMEEKEQCGPRTGHLETVVSFECVRYEQIILIRLLITTFLAAVFLFVCLPGTYA